MQAVTVINRLTIKPGKIDELIEAQRSFAASLTSKPSGLLGSRTYRSVDGKSVVLVSQFESISAQEEIRQAEAFKLHLKSLQSFVENSDPGLYEEVSTTGKFI
jgi:quinol monooxygenase YgiN